MLRTCLALLGAVLSVAQFVNQDENALNLTVIRSPGGEDVTISYKEPRGVCRTSFDTQKQYTGWVNVPGDYPTNLFFWFVEARQPTKSLTIWLNGGPGSSSMLGFFAGNGPCEVVEKGLDNYDTLASDWGWDRASNMLFIDQPNQVGLSYDIPTNGTANLITEAFATLDNPIKGSNSPWATLNGTFSSLDGDNTANTTQLAAISVWHMLQGFLAAFPEYHPPDNHSVGINLFTESYGGRYTPIFADIWEEQNQKRLTGELSPNKTLEVHLVSVGIVNGCVDRQVQLPLDPIFANQNTYGYKAISDETAKFYRAKFDAKGGCGYLLQQCVQLAQQDDSDGNGAEETVNHACAVASNICYEIEASYYSAGRSPYDLAAPYTDPHPPMRFIDYLNRAEIQQMIGARTNYTLSSDVVFARFAGTGDIARGQTISRLADLINRGIRVGLIYGDRDYICNWFGGEAVSLQVASKAGGEYASNFPAAGYAPIIVNGSYVGGVVRQFGNLSFSRVYQAGHSVAYYQPETAFQVFARILNGRSVSTGQGVDLSIYKTTGPRNATERARLPSPPAPTCYIRAFRSTCDASAEGLARSGEGVVINGILYSASSDWPLMKATAASTEPTATTKTTETLTGIFSATDTPDTAAALDKLGLLRISSVLAVVLFNLNVL